MSSQSAALSGKDDRADRPAGEKSNKPGEDQANVIAGGVTPSRKRLFFHFEIGIKKTTTYYPDCAAGAQEPQRGQDVAVVQPVLAFSAGAPKQQAIAPEGVAAPQPPQAPAHVGGSGSSIKATAGYASGDFGIMTETPPYSGGGGGGTGV